MLCLRFKPSGSLNHSSRPSTIRTQCNPQRFLLVALPAAFFQAECLLREAGRVRTSLAVSNVKRWCCRDDPDELGRQGYSLTP
jgi:hypothetical protein